MQGFLSAVWAWLVRLRNWAQQNPALAAPLLLLVVFGLYLPTSDHYRLYYDANNYWVFGQQYFKTGSFSWLSYTSSMRGYLFSLLLAPFSVAGPHLGLEPIQLSRPLGALLAAFMFGMLGPALWRAASGLAVSLGRRLAFGLLGFVLWRDYFNFPLTDFPALAALAIALWALLSGGGMLRAVLAGLALGAAANMRPVFQAALPFVCLLSLLPPAAASSVVPGRRYWGRLVGVATGLALVLAPQFYINLNNFGERTPWVLAYKVGDPTNLFLQQLQWGLQYQKYETNVGYDYPRPQMFFLDAAGQQLFDATKLPLFTTQAQYLEIVAHHPVGVGMVWLRHLFNGLDLQYPTPYITRVFVATWPLAWLNYTVLLGGCAVLLGALRRRPRNWRVLLALAALLTPCLGALPVAMECRFLLPLHLVLSGALVFGCHPRRAWQAASGLRRMAWAAGYVLLVGGAFAVSADAQRSLEKEPRPLLGLPWQRPEPEPW